MTYSNLGSISNGYYGPAKKKHSSLYLNQTKTDFSGLFLKKKKCLPDLSDVIGTQCDGKWAEPIICSMIGCYIFAPAVKHYLAFPKCTSVAEAVVAEISPK